MELRGEAEVPRNHAAMHNFIHVTSNINNVEIAELKKSTRAF